MYVNAGKFSIIITCFAILMDIFIATLFAADMPPEVRTEKDSYEWKERIVVVFENAPGKMGDWITVVPKETPEKINTIVRTIFLQRRKKGSFTFAAPKKMGQYEVRLYRKDSPGQPVARYSFMVGNPKTSTPDKASSRIPDNLSGLWESEQLCGKYNSIKLQLNVTEFFGVRYAMLKSVDQNYDPERINFDVYKLGEVGDYDGDFFTPERVHNGISGSAYKFQIINSPGKDSIVIDHAICRNLSLSRVTSSEPTGGRSPLNANWQGFVDACKYFSAYPYDIKFELHELPNGIVVAKAQANLESVGPSTSYFYGAHDKTRDIISLRGITKRRDETITLEYADEDNRLYGKSEWLFRAGICDYVELSPAGVTNEAKSSVPSNVVSQEMTNEETFALVGEWEGSATCSGNPARVLLNIDNAPAGRYIGKIEYSFPNVLSHGVTAQHLVGERTQKGDYIFVIDTRKNRIPTLSQAVPNRFSLVANTEKHQLSGHYEESTCSNLELVKRTEDRSSIKNVRANESTSKGTFFAKRRPRERCEIIGEWLSKARNEYPEANFWKLPMGQVYPKMVLLFADDEFIPVFGKPYDALSSNSDAEKISGQVNQICQRDPLSQELVKDFRLVQGFFQGVERNVGSVNGASIRSTIRQTRYIRNLTDQVKSSTSKNTSFEEAIQILEPFKKQIEASAEFLWPNEKRAIEGWVSMKLSRYALTKIDVEFQRITLLSDPLIRLRKMTDLASGKLDYYKYLLEEDKINLNQRLVNSQKDIADSLIGTEISAIESLDINVLALSKISDWEKKINPTLNLLINDTEQFYRNRIEKKRQELFSALVSERIDALETFTADRHSILENSRWIGEFRRSFSGFEDRDFYQKSISRFKHTRRKLLRAGIASFESDLAKLGSPLSGDKADEVLKDYLSWEGDLKIPISLEYLIVTEAMKATER